ncbi:MAG: HAD-IC family P-type ATPase, partial [Dehalococcoidales bacterium]|nr:HAD-IC family P-type ATPase [Dehalococcoidales bacterium]
AHLENLGRLKAIAFDKTGTITKGKPELTDVMVSGSHVTSDELLRFVAAVESRSAHPLAQAVVRAAQARKLDIPTAGEVVSVTGRGIRAKVSGSLVRVGSEKLFAEAGIIVSPNLLGALRELESVGKTAMLVGLEQAAVGLVAVADVLRADSLSAIAALTRLGIRKSIMLTGDNARTAAHIAKLAGIDEVRADLMPEDKLTVIRALVQEHEVVAMVGDGVNDAPALANATVGIAMGGAGTDVALETADVALMGDDLSKLPFAVGLGRATRAVIMQNLVIALSVVAVLIVASVTGWVGIGVAIVVHEGSTIVVVLNSLRLLGYRP